MVYSFVHEGEIWNGKFFAFPSQVVEKYIKLASEYEIKVLLIILNNGGSTDAGKISKSLGITKDSVNDIMDFWIKEGIVISHDEEANDNIIKNETVKQPSNEKNEFSKKSVEENITRKTYISPPNLSQSEIVMAAKQNPEIEILLQEAQMVLGYTLKTSEQELIVNLVNFYGLKPEVVLVILQYYKNEREKGRSIGMSYVSKLAQNWADEGIDTAAAAEEKCKAIERSDSFWRNIASEAGIAFKTPTASQREKVSSWEEHFNIEMIEMAIDIMKENCSQPSFKYLDTILANWIKNGIKTPDDVERDKENHKRKNGKIKRNTETPKATYDIDEIEKNSKEITQFKLD